MTVICAWCGLVLKSEGVSVSHGICEHCAWQVETRLLRDLARQRSGTPPRRRHAAPMAGAALPGFEIPQPA